MSYPLSKRERDYCYDRKVLWDHSYRGDSYSQVVRRSLNVHMLTEDICSGIVPYSYEGHDSAGRTALNPASTQIAKMIIAGLPTGHGYARDLHDAVCSFIRYAGRVLAVYGEMHCEIVQVYEDRTRARLVGFELRHIPPGVLRRCCATYFNMHPLRDAKRTKGQLRVFEFVSKRRIWTLALPTEFGSPKGHKRLLSRLAKRTESLVPPFVLEEMKNQASQRLFDFNTYHREYELWVAATTRQFGWTMRSLLTERSTAYFQLARHLRLKKMQAILRDHILRGLNEVLARIGAEASFKAQISMDGLPTVASYDEDAAMLEQGALPFMQAWMKE